jgi:hypothetical protein
LIYKSIETCCSLHGAISNGEQYYQSTRQGEIHVVPFAYKTTGKAIPSAKMIYDALQDNLGIWYSATKSFDDFGFFNHPVFFEGKRQNRTIQLKDLQLMNLLGRISLDTIHFWQYYRMAHQPVLPVPQLQGTLDLKAKDDRLVYQEADKVKISRLDFAMGVRDEMHTGDVIPSGSYISINKKYLNEVLKTLGMKMAYVYKMQVNQKASTYAKERETDTYYETIDLN